MTSDSNSGITSIEYDTNNLPCSVVIGGTSRNLYTYDASGRKLRATYQVNYFEAGIPDIVVIDSVMKPSRPIDLGGGGGIVRPMPLVGLDGSIIDFEPAYRWRNVYTRDYCGDIIYKDGEIERILTDNGYAVPDTKTGGYDYYYYVKDYQGNIRMVLDEENNIMESNGYYPYGMPMHMGDVQPYKYGSKELDRTNGLDLYDFSARWYDMTLPRFLSLDPLAEKNCSVSPYSYCSGNPVNKIDPTGMDEWEINKRGEIVNRIKTKEHDAFYIVNKNKDGTYEREYSVDDKGNKYYNSISFKYGTVANSFTEKMEGGGSYDAYNINGDENGSHLFEFLAKNTDVEWSKLSYGTSGNSGLNVLTTSHGTSSEGGMTNYVSKHVSLPYIIRSDTHSHPGNTPYPSGLTQSNFGDIQYAKELTNMFRQNISFSIFLPDKNNYIHYNSNSTIFDYPELSPIMKTLDEIIVGY